MSPILPAAAAMSGSMNISAPFSSLVSYAPLCRARNAHRKNANAMRKSKAHATITANIMDMQFHHQTVRQSSITIKPAVVMSETWSLKKSKSKERFQHTFVSVKEDTLSFSVMRNI